MLDPQLKRGLLDVCVLAVLKSGDSYGYKIIKDLAPNIEISESTLYPILRRLEQSESVTTYSVVHNSRLRKMFKITDKGKMQVKDFLAGWDELTKVLDFIRRSENE